MSNKENSIFLNMISVLRDNIYCVFDNQIDNYNQIFDEKRKCLNINFHYIIMDYLIRLEMDYFNGIDIVINNEQKKETAVYSNEELKKIGYELYSRYNACEIKKIVHNSIKKVKEVVDKDLLLWSSNMENRKYYYRYLNDIRYFNSYSEMGMELLNKRKELDI